MDTRVKNKTNGGRRTTKDNTPNKVVNMKSQLAELTRTVAALKTKHGNNDEESGNTSDSTPDDAGNAFGGRQAKKQKKE
jgi:hypothetical protein